MNYYLSSYRFGNQKFRRFAVLNNYQWSLHFLDLPKEVRLERVMKRNLEKGETFEFEESKENFDFMEDWFEKPTEKEFAGGITINA